MKIQIKLNKNIAENLTEIYCHSDKTFHSDKGIDFILKVLIYFYRFNLIIQRELSSLKNSGI